MSYPHYSGDCIEYHGLVRDFGGPEAVRQQRDGQRWGIARPEIVVLCGSTRFVDVFNLERKRLTEEGVIVLSIEVVTTQARDQDPQHVNPELKARLDELHMRKIDLADRVLVLDVGFYIGESTRNEIAYAEHLGRPIEYLSARHASVHPSAMADAS